MRGYSAREVATMLDLSVGQLRAYVRAGFLEPQRGTRGQFLFSFTDLVLLKTARGLLSARVPSRRVRRALRKLKEQLPTGRSLAGVRISADGDHVVVHDGSSAWMPHSGQGVFDFNVRDISEKIAPFAVKAAAAAGRERDDLTAEDWYDWACDLEAASPAHAKDAYLRAIELNSKFADAHVNLGRLLQEEGDVAGAVKHYERALATNPEHPLAAFNLGVALEDLGRTEEAIAAYENAVRLDPTHADAHYNVSRLYETLDRPMPALKHLRAYRALVRN